MPSSWTCGCRSWTAPRQSAGSARCRAGEAPRIVVLTASALEEDRRSAQALGADEFLGKPFLEADLFALLGRLLGVEFEAGEPAPAPAAPPAGDAGPAAALPAELVAGFRNAAAAADLDRLRELIATVAAAQPAFAQALRARAEAFDYEQMLALIESAGTSA